MPSNRGSIILRQQHAARKGGGYGGMTRSPPPCMGPLPVPTAGLCVIGRNLISSLAPQRTRCFEMAP
ncbi:hypothetical protein BDY21DRAFT_352401 [Lineolata rhizophorae]|uniref:Uncharacterized protein n=1 Tax=Lineolata rhizophorae TaxID=578093 RepID=A0A6A6NSY3_9PEZI|nr:hypothetical protein BDY21DRAFT_352401 [Lineolata rhizophorae]